jgi:hypothetical protein
MANYLHDEYFTIIQLQHGLNLQTITSIRKERNFENVVVYL